MLKFIKPPLALITAEPIVSPTIIVDIENEPLLELNNAVDISGSFGSWLTEIVKSAKLSQSVLDNDTNTVGLNGIHATNPVLPPTQLPQLSIKAVPFGSPLQSQHIILRTKLSVCVHPNELTDVKTYVPEVLYTWPFTDQVYVPQAVSINDDDVLLLMVKLRVWVLSQPATLVYTLV